MICETRLDDTVHSSEVFPQNFEVYRCDRSEETEKFQSIAKKGGGGVLIAIEKSLKSQMIGTGASYGAEQVWAKIKLNTKNIFLVKIYIRPDSPDEVYDANMRALRDLTSKMKIEDVLVLSGDFNLPKLAWFTDDNDDPDTAIPINASKKKELMILDTCHDLGTGGRSIQRRLTIINHTQYKRKMSISRDTHILTILNEYGEYEND